MIFPNYNPIAGFPIESYELLKNLYEGDSPEALWNRADRAKKLTLFDQVLRLYSNDNCVVTAADAEEVGLDKNEALLPMVFSALSQFRSEEVYEVLEFFLSMNDIVENPVAQKYLETDQFRKLFKNWGREGMRFLKKAMMEKEFYHADSEPYRTLSALLYDLGGVGEYAEEVEDVYRQILSRWEWNHPLVNADAIEALSLRKNVSALPLINACFSAKLADEEIIRFNHVKKNYGSLYTEVGFVKDSDQKRSSAPPPYAGDENFGRLLRQVAYMDVDQARLMTVAKIVSPSIPHPSELIEDILSFDALFKDDEVYDFCSDGEARRFVGQVMAFWNECTRYRLEFLPLVKPDEMSTIAFFMRTQLFFYPFLNLLKESPGLFNTQQKAFLRAFRNLYEEQNDWSNELQDVPITAEGKDRYTHPELERRLLELWNQDSLEFVRGFKD